MKYSNGTCKRGVFVYTSLAAIVCAVGLLLLAGRALADGVPPLENQAEVPPGTAINIENYPKYANYFPDGLAWLFTDKLFHFWKIRPTQKMVVSAPSRVNIPHIYAEDTEKYSSQVSLKQTPEGGYSIVNYEAGAPFPHPSGPLSAYQALWNVWYRFAPAATGPTMNPFGGSTVEDGFLNSHYTGASVALYQRIGHLSDYGYPHYRLNPFDFAEYIETFAPEQAKYTVTLVLFYLDPDRVQENWSFSPALRRVLRLSAAARCAPSTGLDLLVEDQRVGWNGQTSTFEVKWVAHKKILAMTNLDYLKLQTYSASEPTADPAVRAAGFPGAPWIPSPDWGTWQPREVYVVDLKKVPSLQQGYCYGNRRMYIDTETWTALASDLYDSSDKPWKLIEGHFGRCKMPTNPSEQYLGQAGGVSALVYDFQNNHVSMTAAYGCTTDHEWPTSWQDLKRYASPSGLAQVMR